jgi:hypothetical protein
VKAERLQKLPPYLFAEIDRKKKAAIAAGRDVINLGVGDPDRPTPVAIIKSLQHHAENPAFHQYALDQGAPELRQSIASFCKERYGLDLDPNSEILPLIGSKEGIAHLEGYRKTWNEKGGYWQDNVPNKSNGHSEAADALRQFGQSVEKVEKNVARGAGGRRPKDWKYPATPGGSWQGG